MNKERGDLSQNTLEQMTLAKIPMQYIESFVRYKEQGEFETGSELIKIQKLNLRGELVSAAPDIVAVSIGARGKPELNRYLIGKNGMVGMALAPFPILMNMPDNVDNFKKEHQDIDLPFADEERAILWAKAYMIASYIESKLKRK